MTSDENSEQPISNQDERDDEYQEIFDFLDHQLGIPNLNERQQYILGCAINDALRAYNGPYMKYEERLEALIKFATGIKEANTQLERFYDDPGFFRAFFRISGWDYVKIYDFRQSIKEANETLQRMTKENLVTKPKASEGRSERVGLFLLVFHLHEGWQKAFNESPRKASTPQNKEINYYGEKIKMGDRGNIFEYFVWSVHAQVYRDISTIDNYGLSIRYVLNKLEGFGEDVASHASDEDITILESDEKLLDKANTEINVSEK